MKVEDVVRMVTLYKGEVVRGCSRMYGEYPAPRVERIFLAKVDRLVLEDRFLRQRQSLVPFCKRQYLRRTRGPEMLEGVEDWLE